MVERKLPKLSERADFSCDRTSPKVIIREGDTLSSIAARELGDGNRWPELYVMNTCAIRAAQRYEARRERGMTGPDWIFPGTMLEIPRR